MNHSTETLVPFSANTPLSKLTGTRTPRPARWLGWLLLLLVIVLPIALLFVPWQQTLNGRGQVVAFAPTERKQIVTARVNGLIGKWHVVEGSRVKFGDAIVDIDDNDPDLSLRLDAQKKFLYSRKLAAEEEMAEQKRAVKAQEDALEAAVKAAKANREASDKMVDVAKQTKENNIFSLGFENLRYEMFEKLYTGSGFESKLNRDEAKMRADRASTEVKKAEADIQRSQASLLTSDSLILQAEATGLSTVATTRRDLRRAEQNVFSVERELQELDSRIERFKARFVKAPVDGTIFRISANNAEGGQYVKEGDELAVIVPDTTERVVELMVDGLDAPLIAAFMEQTGQGPHVRLQFEGWPGVQFTGWPSVAIGTFGGRVKQMDPTDDGNGRFRILVEPEPMFEDDDWPEGLYLRQGNQAIGWVFLNRVTLGYELWRQLNGFPPVIAPKAPSQKKDSKPPKIKKPS